MPVILLCELARVLLNFVGASTLASLTALIGWWLQSVDSQM